MFHRIKSLARRGVRRLGYEITAVKAALPRAVKADYDPILELIGSYRFKFLDFKTFLPMTISRAYSIGLHKSKPLEILDIGTGVGYFPVVCRYYGHTVIAIDRDGNQVFEDVTKWLNVDRRSWDISAFQAIPNLGRRFDLATAFMVNFDRFEGLEHRPWGAKEWEFFLADLAHNHLKDNGRLVLLLNGHTLQVRSVMEYFAAKGAQVRGPWVDFTTLSAFKPVTGCANRI